jgi:hypothetical protein
VDDAGHLMQYDAPVALADEIRSWLDDRSVGAARVSRRRPPVRGHQW